MRKKQGRNGKGGNKERIKRGTGREKCGKGGGTKGDRPEGRRRADFAGGLSGGYKIAWLPGLGIYLLKF